MFNRIRRVGRKSIALGLIFALSGAVSPANAGDTFTFVGKSEPGEYFFTVGEDVNVFISTLSVQPEGISGNGTRGVWRDCYSTTDPECDLSAGAGTGIGESGVVGRAILDICTTATQVNCVENLEISNKGADFKSAKYLRKIRSNREIPANLKLNYPGGSVAQIWDDSLVGLPSVTKYLVSVAYGIGAFGGNTKYSINNIIYSIIPYREVVGNFTGPNIDPNLPSTSRATWGSDGRYFFNEDGASGVRLDFEPNQKFRLNVRISNQITGWFSGRLKDPVASIKKFNDDNNLISISGEPVVVPTIGYKRKIERRDGKWSLDNIKENEFFNNNGQSNNTSPQYSGDRKIFDYLEHFRPLVKDAAIGTNSYWTMKSIASRNENSCLNDSTRVLGIVTTNAMGYNPGSPEFKDGYLNYQVAGMHYESDGITKVLGSYDLLINPDAARCLYSFSKAPVSATISVLSDNAGVIPTTLVSESAEWIKLSAYGFNFSSPVIRVILTQEKEPEAPAKIVEETAKVVKVPKAASKKVIFINCLKGKTTKKVSGTNPKCPIGYKKK